ncbi:MAG: KH domain-containing protein [Christensenellales bacterium]|jgi:predicted RNA-binding protein YlqC (UPF0109 family)
MRDLVDYIVKNIIDEGTYDIIIMEEEDQVDIKIIVDKEQVSKIIGKSGRIARAIRTIVRAASNKSDSRYSLYIEER